MYLSAEQLDIASRIDAKVERLAGAWGRRRWQYIKKALFRDQNQTIKRTLFTLQRRPDAFRGVFQPFNGREFTLNA